MDQDGSVREEGVFQGEGNRDETGDNNNNGAPMAPAAQVEMNSASESNNSLAAAAPNNDNSNRGSSAPAAASIPSNVNVGGLTQASHQSMLRQLAHSPTSAVAARPAAPNRNAIAGSPQEALRQAHPQPQQQPQPQQPLRQPINPQPQQPLNINAAVANNNNNNNNNNMGGYPINDNIHHQHMHPERAMETENVFHPCSPSGSASSGWSVVETSQGGAGGAPPSARSLHAAALLNGIMYVFGGM